MPVNAVVERPAVLDIRSGSVVAVERPYRLLVTGSRAHRGEQLIRSALIAVGHCFGRDTVLVHGAAAGADSIAAGIWSRWGLAVEPHPADWARCGPDCPPGHQRRNVRGHSYCPAAGHRRNDQMIGSGADLCLAFPVGPAAGTGHCVRQAGIAGIPCLTVTAGTPLTELSARFTVEPTSSPELTAGPTTAGIASVLLHRLPLTPQAAA
jgi:YspA, cpYpsA-related SLOG family